MSVDWVSIEFDIAIPVVLAHGIKAQSDTWDDDTTPGNVSPSSFFTRNIAVTENEYLLDNT
ncbi:hypothetical protein V4D06_17860 [Vibrio mimicus]|uniref:hypothetical protein n=1 Tax=Vibrio mimicus TaxID=674 RepID=UPI002F933EFE